MTRTERTGGEGWKFAAKFKMAATSKLKKLNVSLAISSSASSVETEQSVQEYTEDFHSEFQSSVEEVSSDLSEISTDYSGVDAVDIDEYRSKFVSKKLQILKENRLGRTGMSTAELRNRETLRELNPFWIKKLETLRKRNAIKSVERERQINMCKLNTKSENNYTSRCNDSEAVAKENEIGSFQAAYERLKFENLREKCRRLIESDVHSLEFCKKCKKLQDELVKSEFCKNCVRKVREKNVEEKFSEHVSSRSSAMLIANIIQDGPKPTWSSDEIWKKLLSGGYQQGGSMIQST